MNPLTPDVAIERAQELANKRVEAVRKLVKAQQYLADTHTTTQQEREALEASIAERIRAAEKPATQAFNAALKAGWTPQELGQIGLSNPSAKTRTRRRATRTKTQPETTDTPPTATHPHEPSPEDSGYPSHENFPSPDAE